MSLREWWRSRSPANVVDPVALDRSLAIVGEKLCADGELRSAVRVVLGWLQAEKHGQLLARLSIPAHDRPDMAREEDVRDAATACGIEDAGELLTNESELRMVRDWLVHGSESTTDAEGRD